MKSMENYDINLGEYVFVSLYKLILLKLKKFKFKEKKIT